MIFIIDSAFALELIALIFGATLLLLANRERTAGRGLAKAVAIFSILASMGAMVCTVYYSLQYRATDDFRTPWSVTGNAGEKHEDGMMKCPMMDKMGKKPGAESQPGEKDEMPMDHESHH